MNEEKSCSFFGHRKINILSELLEKLKATVKELIEDGGVSVFYFGGFGEFDDLCWRVVTELKEKYCYIKRVFCLSDRRYLRESKRPRWLKDEDYEEFIYIELSFDWWYQRIYYRNVEIINRSDYIIFYAEEREESGAYKALKYANKCKKSIINLV